MKARLLLAFLGFAAAGTVAESPESEEYRDESVPDVILPAPVDGPTGASAADSAAAAPSGSAAPVGGAAAIGNPVLAKDAAAGDTAGRPSLALMPTAANVRGRPGETERESVTEALRLGSEQTRRYRILTQEETALPYGRRSAVPTDCFSALCALKTARKFGVDLILLSELKHGRPLADGAGAMPPASLALALVETRTGRVRKTVWAKACPGDIGPIPFAQQAVWLLLLESASVPADSAGTVPSAATASCSIVQETAVDSGSWTAIPWLNPTDTVDNRMRWAAAGSGLLAAGLGLAWIQGQLFQEDGKDRGPAGPLRSGSGATSFLRGFFALPNLGAQYAAMGGAGIAHVSNALAVNMNPAGVADATRESVVAAKRNLPGGTPSLFLAYAGPLAHGWFQGLGIQHEGDDLANETTVEAVLAGDWGAVTRSLAGLKTGGALKFYLAKVGESGAGIDRSTGHSFGMGLDLGLRMHLSPKITGAVSVRDAFGFLRHTNTFTDREYWEVLPPEYRIGAAYQVSPATLLLIDGQKGMVADQIDHVRFGGERMLFDFLALRAGLHQAFGRQAVRKLALGFGLDSEAMGDRRLRNRIAVNYAYDFGLGENEPLGAGQQFSLEVSW